MAIKEPFPKLDEILASIGEGDQRIATIDAAEGAAGSTPVAADPVANLGVVKASATARIDVRTTIL